MEEKDLKNVEIDENNNTENNYKQKNSKKNAMVVIGVVVSLLIVLGMIFAILFSGSDNQNNNNELVNATENKIENEAIEEENKISKKIDESKPWVYDADYLLGRENKQTISEMQTVYKVSNELKAPYININSNDAKKANKKIKEIYDESYNNNFNDYSIGRIRYEVKESGDFLSVLMYEDNFLLNGGGRKKLYVYTFNLNTLNYASFEEVCAGCDIERESVKNKIYEIANKTNFDKDFNINNNYFIDNGTIKVVLNNEYSEGGMFVFIGTTKQGSAYIVDESSFKELYGYVDDNKDLSNNEQNNEEVINQDFQNLVGLNIDRVELAMIQNGAFEEIEIVNNDNFESLKRIPDILKSSCYEHNSDIRVNYLYDLHIDYKEGNGIWIRYNYFGDFSIVIFGKQGGGKEYSCWDTDKRNQVQDIIVSYINDYKFKDTEIYSNKEFLVKFPESWKGKYELKIIEELDKGLIYNNFYLKGTNELMLSILSIKESVNTDVEIKNTASPELNNMRYQEINCHINGFRYFTGSSENLSEGYSEVLKTNLQDYKNNIQLVKQSVQIYDNKDNLNEKYIKYFDQRTKGDFSFMTKFKNTVYENDKKEGEYYYKIQFDENSNPTIFIEQVGYQPYDTYKEFFNIKMESNDNYKYVTFDYIHNNGKLNDGKGKIKYNDTTNIESIELNLNYPFENIGKTIILKKVK